MKYYKILRGYVLLGFVLMTFQLNSQTSNEKADLILEQLITENKVAGVVAGYSIEGKIKWQSALGYSDIEQKLSMNINTITRPASLAKPMTAIAVMQLVEKGLIDLDAPIQTYISDFPEQDIKQITTRQLLSHTSGIGEYKNAKEAQNTINYASIEDAVEVFKHRKLLFEPGSKFSYTTYGYVVLGLLIEKVSGVSFEAYMKENIWDKAHMSNTGVEKFDVFVQGKSQLFGIDKKGRIKEETPNNLSNRIPGGGFYTTLGDVFNFGTAVLNNTLVSGATLDIMRQHHSLEKESNAYGFGWFLYNPKPNEGEIIGHSGAQTGSSSQLFIIPSSKTVIVVMANTTGSWEEVIGVAAALLNESKKNH